MIDQLYLLTFYFGQLLIEIENKNKDLILEISQHCHVIRKNYDTNGTLISEDEIWPYVHSHFNLTMIFESWDIQNTFTTWRDYLAKIIAKQILLDVKILFKDDISGKVDDMIFDFTSLDNRRLFNQKLFEIDRIDWMQEQEAKFQQHEIFE